MKTGSVIRAFDAAAQQYDKAATIQSSIAQRLVDWAYEFPIVPQNILDLGAGTGFVAERAQRQWPKADITAVDASLSMLKKAKNKIPSLSIVESDLDHLHLAQRYDLILSSMAIHWLPQPEAFLAKCRNWLSPNGKLCVAFPIEGSFQEWRQICQHYNLSDGLWPLPSPNVAQGMANRTHEQKFQATYNNVHDFLRSIKAAGAATSRPGHKPASISRMRLAIKKESHNFPLTYRLLFAEISGSDP